MDECDIDFLDLVQEFGAVFLKVFEYSLNINLKFLYISSFYIYIFWNVDTTSLAG